MASINKISYARFTSAVLIGDTESVTNGSTDNIPALTNVTVSGTTAPVDACLELKSIKGAFLPPRMTTAQKNALVYVTTGMRVFDTDLNSDQIYINSGWSSIGVMQFASGTINNAGLLALYATPSLLVAAPGAGLTIMVNQLMLELVYAAAPTGGGAVFAQYKNTVNAGGTAATATIPAAGFTGAAASTIFGATGLPGTIAAPLPTTANTTNSGIYLTNGTANFGGGAGSSLRWYLNYTVVPVT